MCSDIGVKKNNSGILKRKIMSEADPFFNVAAKSETTKARRYEDKIGTPDFGGKIVGDEMLKNVSFGS